MTAFARRWTTALLGAVLLVAACDDDDDDGGNGPGNGNTLSAAEQAVLIDALLDAGLVEDAGSAALLGIALEGEVGSITIPAPSTARGPAGLSLSRGPTAGAWDAIAFQADISVNGVNEEVLTAMLAWHDIDVSAGTVDEMILWYVPTAPPGFPSTFSASYPFDGGGSYVEEATGSTYGLSTGTVELFSTSFVGSSFDCSGNYSGIPVECSARSGEMEAAFEFFANLITGTGPEMTSFPYTYFEIPATQLTVDATLPTE